ncbi:MAG TPA: 30S ribosomal protein S7 [Blastocatellia bacterium]|nr:30S ribosomal protein S7 [Blastocatellia bacterium]
MPRRRVASRREVLPDPVYNSTMVSRFINSMMWQGKKSASERIFYKAMDYIKSKTQEDPLKVFKKAVENVKPRLEVKSRRVGGSTYQVPIEVDQRSRGNSLAVRWLILYSRGRGEKSMVERLGNEILDAASNRGNAVKKKEDTHRMADANKAFAHYRW